MRRIATNEEVFFEVPNHLLFTNSPYSYVKITAMNDTDYIDQPFTLAVKSKTNEFEPVRMTRLAKPGTVWPIGAVLESLAAELNASVVKDIVLEVEQTDLSVNVTFAIVGTSNYEYTLSNMVGENMTNLPAPQKTVIYPGFNIEQYLYLPIGNGTINAFEVALGWGSILATSAAGVPFVPFDSVDATSPQGPDRFEVSVEIDGRDYYFVQPVEIDHCTDGVLLKWLDKHSIPCIYRWSVESVEDATEVEETTVSLDDNLQPVEHEDRILTHSYKLHSRPVEQKIYDLCASILGNRALWMYDSETEEWRPCALGEGNAVDGGNILRDLVIEVQIKEYIR